MVQVLFVHNPLPLTPACPDRNVNAWQRSLRCLGRLDTGPAPSTAAQASFTRAAEMISVTSAPIERDLWPAGAADNAASAAARRAS